ncbi:hypothetical protein JSY36_05110 [Bacillus sp. H-16]|uniref:hypothetical protein n=1 Tax=Alteribacter salitolerans TaxID=2912333 RepID=UPI0019662CB6|nr:hypothetical protein [Alteribacter salitolerans]MBM7095132.1 hypothetical protein [Alteribacter salitolerans]
MKRMVFMVIGLLGLAACSNETSALPGEMPEDFDFSLRFGIGSANELNTFEDTYTKDLIEDGRETTVMVLTEEEMALIYEEMRDANVLDMSGNAGGAACSDPHNSYHLSLQADDETYSDVWDTSCETRHTKKWESFMAFLLTEIIHPKPEYQELPEARGGYD